MHNPSNRSRDGLVARDEATFELEVAAATSPIMLQMLGIGGGCVPARQRSYSVPIGAPVTGRCRTGIGGKTNMSKMSNADYDRHNVPYVERVFGNGVTLDVKRQGKGQYSATLRTGIGGSSRRFVQPIPKGAWYAGVGGSSRRFVQPIPRGAWYAGVGATPSTIDPFEHCIEHAHGKDCYEKQPDGTWIRVSTTPASSAGRPGGIRVQATGHHLGGGPVHTRTGGSTAGRADFAVTFPTKRYGQESHGRVPLYSYSNTRNVTPSKTEVRRIAASGRKISAFTLARR